MLAGLGGLRVTQVVCVCVCLFALSFPSRGICHPKLIESMEYDGTQRTLPESGQTQLRFNLNNKTIIWFDERAQRGRGTLHTRELDPGKFRLDTRATTKHATARGLTSSK